MLTLLLTAALAWEVVAPQGAPGRQVDALFEASSWPAARLQTDPADLKRVAGATAAWLRAHPDDPGATAGALADVKVKPLDVLRTLDTIVAMTDAELADPAVLAARFQTWRWTPDVEGAAATKIAVTDRIRLTRYLVYRAEGSPTRTAAHDTALYAAPADPTRFTRSEVRAGVYRPGGEAAGEASPLVWLSRRDANRALMQGSTEVHVPDAPATVFNVHRHNNIPYVRGLKDPDLQDRYWYFRAVDQVRGYGTEDKIPLAPWVSVAGDPANLGIGQIVALELHDGLQLAVLSDTGGAFQPNLFQLDLYTGTWAEHAAFKEGTRRVPDRVPAWILVARP